MKNIQQQVIDGKVNPYELLEFWNEKELSRNDIESLCNEFNYKLINTYKGPQGMERYDIIDSNGTILIEYITRCMTNFSIGNINITIRNKSELKVLFQQLNIY